MSETPKRRRLTDQQIAPLWEKVGLSTRGQASGAGMVLEWDHMQAREDRKRLAEMLREIVDDDAAALHKGREAKVRALLAEVDP